MQHEMGNGLEFPAQGAAGRGRQLAPRARMQQRVDLRVPIRQRIFKVVPKLRARRPFK